MSDPSNMMKAAAFANDAHKKLDEATQSKKDD
jgi:hypothetical protein